MNNRLVVSFIFLSLFAATAAFSADDIPFMASASAIPQADTIDAQKEQARAEKAKARAAVAKAEADLAKFCAESDITASDMVKAERDRVCASKIAKDAAEAHNDQIREEKARHYAEAEAERARRDKIHSAAAKLKAADEINIESPEAIVVRSGPGNPVLGRVKSQVCQGCHGLRGYSVITLIPKLAGQYAHYIAKELRNYQAGTRTHQIMTAMAASITDEDLDDIAAHFAVQKKMSGGGTEENPIGKNLFLNGDVDRRILPCVNCHGSDGKGRRPWTAVFPVIGGQHKDYLRVQLQNFRSDNRTNSPVAIMNLMTHLLTDEEIEGLADYISGR